MARTNPRTKKPKTPPVPQSTPSTTAQIQSSTGRISTGSSIDRLRYHQRPTLTDEREEVEAELSAQTVSSAGVIGSIGKTVAKAGETVTKIAPKITKEQVKKAGRRTVAPGIATTVASPMDKPEPVEKISTDIFGAPVPGYDDDSYKEGPAHVFDWGGYYNLIRATAVPTEQLIQMPKDIIEGVPEEKRTMRESGLDLALMPILGPLIGQKEYGIGTEEYQPWEYGFADPRNIFTGTMAHNLAVAGYAMQQPAYYDAVGQEYEVSAQKFEKHKPYYIATTVGELPYFMLGIGQGAFAVRAATKAAAMSVRLSTGAKRYVPGTARYFKEPTPVYGEQGVGTAVKMTQISRPWLAAKGQMLAYDIESAPSRMAQALTKLRKPTPVGVTMQPIVRETAFGDLETVWVPRPAQKTKWADIGAPDSRINRFIHRVTKRRQQDSYDLANLFAQAFKIKRKAPHDTLFLSELGDIIHVPSTIGLKRPGYVGGSTRGIYENLLDPSVSETIIGQPITRYLEPTAGMTGNVKRGLSPVLSDPELSRVIQQVLSEHSITTIDNATLFGRTTTGKALPATGKVSRFSTSEGWATGFIKGDIPDELSVYLSSVERARTPPPQVLQGILKERGFKIYGTREPIPGTDEAKQFERLTAKQVDIEKNIDVLTESKRFDGMKGVSWFELVNEPRFASTKKWFQGQVPSKYKSLKQDDPPEVVKLKAEYQSVKDNMTEATAIDGEEKLRSIGHKISVKMYGEKGIDASDIREAKTLFAKGRTGKLDAELEDSIISSLPFQTQKQITALKAQKESINIEKQMLLDKSPKMLGPATEKVKVLMETKTDPLTDLPLKESIQTFQPPEGIRVYREPGKGKYGDVFYRIEAENVDDPTTQSMLTFYAHKTTKAAAKSKGIPEPYYYEIPKKMKGRSKKDVWVLEAQKASDDDDLIAKMMGSPKKSAEQTKLLETNLGPTGLLRNQKFLRTYGIEESFEVIGKENVEKIKRLKTLFPWKSRSLFRRQRITSQKTVEGEELIEGKKVYRFSNTGKDLTTDKAWELTRDDVKKFLDKGTSGNNAKDKVLSVRHMLFGGGSEYNLQQSLLKDKTSLSDINKQIDNIRMDREKKLTEAEQKTTVHNIMSGLLRDERNWYRGDFVGNISKGKPLTFDEVKTISRYEEGKTDFIAGVEEPKWYKEWYEKQYGKSPPGVKKGGEEVTWTQPTKPRTDVLHMDDVTEETIRRYDIKEVTPEGKIISTPEDTAKQWGLLLKEADEVKANLQGNTEELSKVRELFTKKKMKKSKDPDSKTGEEFWETTGESGTPQVKSVSSLTVEYVKSQFDNEIASANYKGFQKTQFATLRRTVERQMELKKKDGTPVVPKEEGQDFKDAYDFWSRTYNETIDTPTLKGKIYELAKKNPAFSETKLPDEITDTTNVLADTQQKLVQASDKISAFRGELDSPRFRLLQAQQDILVDTEELLKVKLSKLKRNKEFFKTVRADDLVDEYKNVDGELPNAVQKKIESLRKEKRQIMKTGAKIRYKQFEVKRALFSRVAKQGRYDHHTFWYTPDGQQNFAVGKLKSYLEADTPEQHDMRVRRSRLGLDITELDKQKHEYLISLEDWKITELKGYAKLNLERKYYNLLKDPNSTESQIRQVRQDIKGLENIAGDPNFKNKLIKIATDDVPDDYSKSIAIDAKLNIKSEPDTIKIISGGQTGVDQLSIELARQYGFTTGGTMPKGFKTSTGSNKMWAKRYGLSEGPTSDYPTRTAKNVEDADLTVVYGDVKLSNDGVVEGGGTGSKLTVREAVRQNKRYLINPTAEELDSAVKTYNVKTINVAGSRKLGTRYTDTANTELQRFFRRNKPDDSWVPTTSDTYNVVDPDKFVAKHPDWYNTLMPEELRPIDSVEVWNLYVGKPRGMPQAFASQDQGIRYAETDGGKAIRFMNIGVLKKRIKSIDNEINDIKYKRVWQTEDDKVRYRTVDEWKESLQEKSKVLTEEREILKTLYKTEKAQRESTITVNYKFLTDDTVSEYPGNLEGTMYNIKYGQQQSRYIQEHGIPGVESRIQALEVEKAGIESQVMVEPRYQKWRELPGNWDQTESHFTKWTKWYEIPQLKHEAMTHKRPQLFKLHKKQKELTEKLRMTKERIEYVQELPPTWRNFSLIPRGTVYRFTGMTLAREIPIEEETVVELRSKSNPQKSYIVKDDKFYELPAGDLGPEDAARVGLTPLSDAEAKKLFKVPFQNIKELVIKRREDLVNKLHPLDEAIGTEPSEAQKMTMRAIGKPDTYAVSTTTIGKIASRFGVRGGYQSRVGGDTTLAGWANVAGQVTERFVADLSRGAEKGTVGGVSVIKKTYDDFTAKSQRGGKTVYESQYKLSRYLAGDTKERPAGVLKERIYQLPSVLPDRPGEDLVGIERVIGDTGDIPIRYKMDLTEEPLLRDIYPSKANLKKYDEGKSNLPPVYETLPSRVSNFVSESGVGGKQLMRKMVSYKYVKNIQGQQLKKTATIDTDDPFVSREANQLYRSLLSDDAKFERLLDDLSLDGTARRATAWEHFQQGTFKQDMESKHKFINIADVLPGDTWVGRGALHTEIFSQSIGRFLPPVRKEGYINAIELAEYQTLLRAARDSGVSLTKQDKKFLKMQVKLSDAEVSTMRIKRAMVRETGSETGMRDWSDANWAQLAEKDPTWAPHYKEYKKMGEWLDRVEQLKMGIKQNKSKLGVLEKIKNRTPKQNKQIDSLKKKIGDLNFEKENKEDYLAGFYHKPAENKEQAVFQTMLRDVSPKPIGRNAKGEMLYEETPFTHMPKVGEEGYQTKWSAYWKWMKSEEAMGPKTVIGKYKKEYTDVEQTSAGLRLKKTSQQKVSSEAKELRPHRVEATYDPTFVSVEDTTDLFYKDLPVSVADVKRLQKGIAGKKLSPDGIKNSNNRIKDLQEELNKINTTDTSKFSKSELDRFTDNRNWVLEKLRLEVNRRGMQSDRVSKFKPINVEDIEKGTYTPESGSSQQATMMAERDMTRLLGQGRIEPPEPRYTGLYKKPTTLPLYATPGLAYLRTATTGPLPEASATHGPASATLQENLDYLSTTVSAGTIQTPETQKPEIKIDTKPDLVQEVGPRGRMIDIPTLRLTAEEQTRQIQDTPAKVASVLDSQLREIAISREDTKFKLQMPEPLKTTPITEQQQVPVRITTTPRIKPPLPVAFGWLDPEERRKRAAKLKKKKKKKIAWAVPDWWAGKGYYFPSGAAYTAFKKKEPRVVRRQERKLGEQKWSDSKTTSVFAERPITKRKPRGVSVSREPKKARQRKKRSDLFGSTSTKRKGY